MFQNSKSIIQLRPNPQKPSNDQEKLRKVSKVDTSTLNNFPLTYSTLTWSKYKDLLQKSSEFRLKPPASQVLQITASPFPISKHSIPPTKLNQSDNSEFKHLKKNTEKLKKSLTHSRLPTSTLPFEIKQKPQKPFDVWKFNNKIPQSTKVFIIQGKYQDLRSALLRRGWVENLNNESIFFDLKWARSARVPFGILDWQLFNHFPNNLQLTAKWNLCKNLNKLLQKTGSHSSSSFFPRCFKLNDSGFSDFSEYFKLNFAISLLKDAISNPYSIHYEKLGACIGVCKRWVNRLKLQQAFSDENESKVVLDHDWRILNINDSRLIGCYYARYYKDEDLHAIGKSLLETLKQYDPQYSINGNKNIWIVKPGHKSRGRNISLHTNLKDIYDFINTSEYCIVQKYIENPLLINNKKFDFRLWVLVSSSDPLNIWIFKDCYLRFSVHDYSNSQLGDMFTHLTNNSISKKAKGFFDSEIEGCMWNLNMFRGFLIREHGEDLWENKIFAQIKKVVIKSILAVKDLGRRKSFELFGYDLMVDCEFNTWLIEINSSPAMDYSTVSDR